MSVIKAAYTVTVEDLIPSALDVEKLMIVVGGKTLSTIHPPLTYARSQPIGPHASERMSDSSTGGESGWGVKHTTEYV
jgi:hypothetical protein